MLSALEHDLKGRVQHALGVLGGAMVKNPPYNAGATADVVFSPWVGKMPWRRKWQPTPVFLPGKSHGQRSLAGHSPQAREESDTTGD